jgi:hypothetical protein
MATVHETSRWSGGGKTARIINALLGVWLFISAFVLPRTESARTNTWLLGVLIAGFAIASLFVPMLRWVVTACSVWLFFSTLVIHHASAAARSNNLIVAVIVFCLSLVPNVMEATAGRGVPPPHRA